MIDISSLNDEQQAAVLSNEKQVLCLAGAGTGKTQCMIYRIRHLIEDQNVLPSNILVLTYTNAAAYEMQDRYKKLSKTYSCPEFRTFHGFCYSLLCRNKDVLHRLGYSTPPTIIEEEQFKEVVTTAKLQANTKLSNYKISHPDKLSPKEKFQYDLYHKALKRLLNQMNAITFDLLADEVCNLFIQNDNVIEGYLNQYKYIFVDEFQDTDPLQYKFIKTFTDANKFVIGDALQAIYAFRNADSSIIKSLASSNDWITYRLHRNYRSTKQICEFSNRYSVYADDSYRIAISSEREGNPVYMTTTRLYKPDGVAKECLDDLVKAVNYYEGSIAILARTNKEVGVIKDHLLSEGITITDTSNLETAIKILKLIDDDQDDVICWLASKLSQPEYAKYLQKKLTYLDYNMDMFLRDFYTSLEKNDEAKKFMNISQIINYGSVDQSSLHLIATTLYIDDILPDEHIPALTVQDFGKYLESLYKTQARRGTVYVGTIHSSKGLEYDTVILINVGGPPFRLSNEENKNLYYVGITRAKNTLIIYKGGDLNGKQGTQ